MYTRQKNRFMHLMLAGVVALATATWAAKDKDKKKKGSSAGSVGKK